jgi:hypothetical protein
MAQRPEPFDRLEVDTWEAIISACPDANRKNMAARINSYGRKRYTDKCVELDNYITNACSVLMRLSIRNGVRQAVLHCLLEWMGGAGIPVSVHTLLNCLDYLPGAVEENFPGYSQAKLLHKVAPLAMVA